MKAATAARMPKVRNDEISIHAAREGGDYLGAIQRHKAAISIHAAREGGDARPCMPKIRRSYFNPRRP